MALIRASAVTNFIIENYPHQINVNNSHDAGASSE